jgi:hypothetical protein
MHLISWNHSRGSEIITMDKTQVSPLPDKIFINFYQQSNLVICQEMRKNLRMKL